MANGSWLRAATLAAVMAAGLSITTETRAQGEPSKADGAKRAEAIERFDRGVELYKEGNYAAALSEFRAAYELSPSYRVLYNIGQVNFQLQDYVSALKALETYLAEGQGEVPAARRAEVEEMLGKLRGRVSLLEVQSNVAGADLSLDDVPVGKTPLATPLQVNAGRHRVVAVRDGYVSMVRYVDLAGAKTVTLKLDLVPVASSATVAANEKREPAHEKSRMTTLSWIGIGVTGALTAGAIGTGIAALGAKSDLDAAPPDSPTAGDARSRVQTLTIATDVLALSAVATLGTTLAFTFLTPSSEGSTARAAEPRVTGVRLGMGNVAAMGTF